MSFGNLSRNFTKSGIDSPSGSIVSGGDDGWESETGEGDGWESETGEGDGWESKTGGGDGWGSDTGGGNGWEFGTTVDRLVIEGILTSGFSSTGVVARGVLASSFRAFRSSSDLRFPFGLNTRLTLVDLVIFCLFAGGVIMYDVVGAGCRQM
jgi:hypothetical protein